MAIDYKQKYVDIRGKLVEATDVAYRLGYEEGMKEGEQQAQQQAQEQQMMMEQQAQQQAMMGGEVPPEAMDGVPPEMGGEEEQMPMGDDMNEEEGSELDQHIGELESMVAKGEKPKILDIRKLVLGLADVRKSQKSKQQKKVDKVISKQKSFVDNILKKMDDQTKDVSGNLEEVIKEHGFKIES